jgi:PBS lyase HEAT-like repeat
MRTFGVRLLALLLAIELGSAAQAFGQEKEEPKATPFQETSQMILSGCGMQLMEYSRFGHFQSWGKIKGDDFDAEFQKRFKSFPDDLMAAIGNQKSADHDAALAFLMGYASLVRCHAASLSEKDLSLAVHRALAPYTDKIKEGLVKSLQAKEATTQFVAALALLCLDEKHAKANEIFQANAPSGTEGNPPIVCLFIGLARLTSPPVIEYLGRLLKHRDPAAREAAAGAAITMGPYARDLVPALIAFLETGENAQGDYRYPGAIALPQTGNLALMALEGLKEHSKPAIPAILARFPTASDDDQIAMLGCLASAGLKDDACLTVVRKSLQSKKLEMAAACTMLYLAPGDREATDLLKKAIADDATKGLAIKICQQFGPPSREIAASFLPMLDSKDEDVRIAATHALARIGPHAAEAVPGIEKLLAREEDGSRHTFRSTRGAAYALARIRGKEAAAALLRVADSNASGARYAMMYLPDLGDDLPPTTLAVLLRATQQGNGFAAFALSNLGDRANTIRRDLERLVDDPMVGWIIDTALRRIPANQP